MAKLILWCAYNLKRYLSCIISFLTMEYWNQTLQYFLGARGYTVKYNPLPSGAEMQKHTNVQTMFVLKNPILGKIFAKFYAVLTRNWVMSRICAFWWHFFAHFGTLCYFLAFFCTIWLFWTFYAILLQSRFVIIYALLWVSIFWLKPCLCKKLSFCIP